MKDEIGSCNNKACIVFRKGVLFYNLCTTTVSYETVLFTISLVNHLCYLLVNIERMTNDAKMRVLNDSSVANYTTLLINNTKGTLATTTV